MKKLIYFLLFIANYSSAQIIENEVQDLLNKYLESKNLTLKEYAKKYNVSGLSVWDKYEYVYFLVEFDEKGNIIYYSTLRTGDYDPSEEEMPPCRIMSEYNDSDKITKQKYFFEREHGGIDSVEIYNQYANDSILTYRSRDNSLIELEVTSAIFYMREEYDRYGEISFSLKQNFDENKNLVSTTMMDDDGIMTIKYETIQNEKYATVTVKDAEEKVSSEKYLVEKKDIKAGRTDFFDNGSKKPYKTVIQEKNNTVSEMYYDSYYGSEGKKSKKIIYKKDKNGVLIEMESTKYSTGEKVKHIFNTGEDGQLISITVVDKIEYKILTY